MKSLYIINGIIDTHRKNRQSAMAEDKFVFSTEVVEKVRQKFEDGYKISRQEKYWLGAMPLVKKSGLVFSFSDNELLEYSKCKFGIDTEGMPYVDHKTQTLEQSGIQYFSEKYCMIKNEMGKIGNMRLRDYQNDILNLYTDNRFSILCGSRQIGKTITSAITILYYCIFEMDKNIMIAANKKATTDEIVSKIKDIYYYLPFFLKPGVVNWNQSQITFGDTNCKIRSSAATKTAAIGFTIDLLFLDEFAHVPANVVDDYFRSIFPTVSNIKNSKIIITSTPNGYNLFWKLLSDAEKPDGDRDKNEFNSMRVPWHIVSGRFVTYLRIDDYALAKHNIDRHELYQWVRDMGFSEEIRDEQGFMVKEGVKIIKNGENNKWEIHIPNYDYFLPKDIKNILDEKEWANPLSDYFRTLSFNKTIVTPEGEEREKRIKLLELCDISSWKENAIKNIGSLDAFNQEYDLQFLSGAKMVLDAGTMNKIENNIEPFEYIEIPAIEKSLFTTYDSLTWIKDRPDLFHLSNVKDYYICASVDISEGLNGDYSVINFFRLMPKEVEEFPSNVKNMYDLFKLEQIGIYHSNTTSVQELAELAYVIFFEVFNEDKIGVVLEANNWGNEFTKTMQEMFNGRNEYSSHIFYRYKHTQDAEETKIGIKLRSQKNMLVKGYQRALKRGDIMVHHHPTLQEMTKFIKKETAMNYTFKADAGANDDIVMTIVELATVFENYKFHDLVGNLLSELPENIRREVEKALQEAPTVEAVDYSILSKVGAVAPKPQFGRPDGQGNPFSSFGNTNPYTSGNPWKNLGDSTNNR
jgi:hypothetical protein